jgi:hypothetical protein
MQRDDSVQPSTTFIFHCPCCARIAVAGAGKPCAMRWHHRLDPCRPQAQEGAAKAACRRPCQLPAAARWRARLFSGLCRHGELPDSHALQSCTLCCKGALSCSCRFKSASQPIHAAVCGASVRAAQQAPGAGAAVTRQCAQCRRYKLMHAQAFPIAPLQRYQQPLRQLRQDWQQQ